MRAAARILLSGLIALSGVTGVRAKDWADYRAGDFAEADIATPVALEVVNLEATAARKAGEAAKIPAIFCDFPHAATNAIAADFHSAFVATRNDFLAAVFQTFHKPALDVSTIASPGFSNFLNAFNARRKTFPVPAELAAQWARGSEGLEMQAKVLGRLMQIMRRPVYGEELPAGFAVGDLARFISVSRPDETPTLAAVRGGKLIAVTNLTSLARVRMLLRHSFPKEEQDFATALAAYLQPDCAPAVALTQAVRDEAVRELTVVDHYAPGQILIRRHAVIGENELAALAQLAEKVPAALVPTAPVRAHEPWLLAALAGVSLIAIIALAIAWRALQSRPPLAPLPGRVENFPTTATASSSPPINQAVKDAILQELAAMRAGLSKTSPVPPPPAVPANVSKDKSADSLLVNLHEQCVAGLLAEGQALVVANELDKALKCYDTILTLHPDHAEAFVKMGSVLEKLGRNDEAFASYDCAIAVDDSMTMAYLQKGGLCNRLARYEEATRCYEKALVKQEKSPAEIRFKVP